MPCYKCSNGKYKYGQRGNCQFDTLEACKAAEQAIHARESEKGRHRDEDADDKPKRKPKKG
jgi:hypothetical protein